MPITPKSILPRDASTQIATGTVISTGVGSVSVRIRPDLTVAVATSGTYAVGQMVTVAFPGGNLSAAHKWDALLGKTDLVDSLPSDHPYKSAPPTF